MRKQWKQWQTLFSWAPKSLQVATAAMKLEDACSLNFPGGSEIKASACNAGDLGLIHGSEIPWRRKWQPTPVFLPWRIPWREEPGYSCHGESHGGRSLVGYSPLSKSPTRLSYFTFTFFAPWKTSYDKSRQCIEKQRHHFASKGPYSQSYGFSSSHVWMWELDHKEVWAPKNWHFWTVVLEKTLESPFDCKEIKEI